MPFLRELAPSRDELALSEVEQILVLASQQLSLGGNVQAALAGLQVADGKLARLDRPQLAPLRRALARDMDRLKAVPYVDVAGISIKLDQLTGTIDSLPLAKDERLPAPPVAAPAPADTPWLRFVREVWNDLRNVIRIEVSDRPAAPLVTPQQSFFLHENLRLRLLSARLALLSRDERAFKADVQAAIGWLRQYFDLQSKPVQAALAMLARMDADETQSSAKTAGNSATIMSISIAMPCGGQNSRNAIAHGMENASASRASRGDWFLTDSATSTSGKPAIKPLKKMSRAVMIENKG